MWSQEERILLWLDSFPLEPSHKHALLEKHGCGVALVKGFAKLKDEFADESLYAKMLSTLQDGSYFFALAERLKKESITPIFYGGKLYPKGWLTLPDAPLCLYVKGRTELLEKPWFAVVGSRRTVESVKKLGRQIAKELTERFAVLTGAADGGDEAALGGALQGKDHSAVCLIAGGFGCEPKENPLLSQVATDGLLLSACPCDTPVRVYSYEYRNKLLSACSEGLLVLGAAQKSGALITAKYAKEQGKKIFAVPYAPSVAAGEGCNRLIRNGAFLTESVADIFQEYGYEQANKPKLALSETEEKVLTALIEHGEAHVGELSSALGMPVFKLTTVLSSLEIKGVAAKLGGNRYSAV